MQGAGEVNERAVIGGNGSPFDFFEFFDTVVNAFGLTSAEKLAQIVIARKSHAVGGAAVAPSRSEVARQASCSEATLKRSYRLLETFFEVTKRPGKTTEYKPKGLITTDQIERALAGFDPAKGAHHEPGSPCTPAHHVQDSMSRGAPSEGHHEPGPENVPPHPPKDNINNKKNTPLSPPRSRSRQDPFGLNASMQAEHKDCWFDEDDRIQVANGFRSELMGLVGDDEERLRIELDKACTRIGPKTPGTVLKSKVRGQIQTQLSWRRDPPKTANWHDEQAETKRKLMEVLRRPANG